MRARASQASQPQKFASAAPTKPAAAQEAASNMVTEWLKKKAQAQREAAKDFLRSTPAPTQSTEAFSNNSKTVAVALSEQTVAGDGLLQPEAVAVVDAPAPMPSAAMAVQTVAGGVIRGKIYKSKRTGAAHAKV
jgi:hypothetical protein